MSYGKTKCLPLLDTKTLSVLTFYLKISSELFLYSFRTGCQTRLFIRPKNVLLRVKSYFLVPHKISSFIQMLPLQHIGYFVK